MQFWQSVFFYSPYIIVALLGVTGHTLTKMLKYEKTKPDFSIRLWFCTNRISTILSVVLTIAAVFMYYELNQLTYISAFISGYFCDSIFRNGLDIQRAKTYQFDSNAEDEPTDQPSKPT